MNRAYNLQDTYKIIENDKGNFAWQCADGYFLLSGPARIESDVLLLLSGVDPVEEDKKKSAEFRSRLNTLPLWDKTGQFIPLMMQTPE